MIALLDLEAVNLILNKRKNKQFVTSILSHNLLSSLSYKNPHLLMLQNMLFSLSPSNLLTIYSDSFEYIHILMMRACMRNSNFNFLCLFVLFILFWFLLFVFCKPRWCRYFCCFCCYVLILCKHARVHHHLKACRQLAHAAPLVCVVHWHNQQLKQLLWYT